MVGNIEFSTGKWSSADYVLYEDIGVPPDIHVAVSPSDSVMGRDLGYRDGNTIA